MEVQSLILLKETHKPIFAFNDGSTNNTVMLSHSLQQPFPIAMSAISFSTPSSSYYHHPFPTTNPPRVTLLARISCVSNPTRPIRKKTTDQSETQELVRLLTRKITDKEPLLKVLNKHVKVVRTEHCFLLFEELGKHDKWLQCLEVPFLSLYRLFFYFTFVAILHILYSIYYSVVYYVTAISMCQRWCRVFCVCVC